MWFKPLPPLKLWDFFLINHLFFWPWRQQPVCWRANHSSHGGLVIPAGHHLHHYHPLHAQVGDMQLNLLSAQMPHRTVCIVYLWLKMNFDVSLLTGLKNTNRQEAIPTPSGWPMVALMTQVKHLCLNFCLHVSVDVSVNVCSCLIISTW